MTKLYTDYVSVENDGDHPREIVYWADAEKEIGILRDEITRLGEEIHDMSMTPEGMNANERRGCHDRIIALEKENFVLKEKIEL